MNINQIVAYLDNYLVKTNRKTIEPVEANEILERAGLLKDSEDRPGKPLRELLRKGLLPHAFQLGGKGTGWTIPHSNTKTQKTINSNVVSKQSQNIKEVDIKVNNNDNINLKELKVQLENARLKYKPDKIKYLLIAEAPPDSIERFFYYPDVRQHDYLFLGVAQALYPQLKDKFISSGRDSRIKNEILLKLKADGFYLLDLSELPLTLLNQDLTSQLPNLIKKIEAVASKNTRIILIKATVFDTAYQALQHKFSSVINARIPFPSQGGQKLFQIQFAKAIKMVE